MWRWRRLELERKAGLVLLALALAVYASGVLSALPDPKEVIGDIAETLGAWTYLLVGVMAFLETGAFVGLIAPGETVVIAGGVIAGQGEIDLLPLIGLVWVCAVLGDTTSFFIGRRLGRNFLERHGPRVKITHERLDQVEGYFDRHGGKTILIGRFIGLVRALAPFIAGASGLAYRRFLPFSVVGTGLWATTFCVLGYIFWRSFDRVAHIAGQAVFGFGLTVGGDRRGRHGLPAAGGDPRVARGPRAPSARAAARSRSGRAAVPARSCGRWCGSLAPEVRFLVDRLVDQARDRDGGGRARRHLRVRPLRARWSTAPRRSRRSTASCSTSGAICARDFGVDVAKVVTELGSFPSVTALLVVAVVVLVAAQSRPVDAALLRARVRARLRGGGRDQGRGRPRAAGRARWWTRASPPSRAATPRTPPPGSRWRWRSRANAGCPSQAAIITGAIVLAAAIGLTRVYLRAHYWSDVAGGWALGAGIFGLLATIALIVEQVRNNERGTAASPP